MSNKQDLIAAAIKRKQVERAEEESNKFLDFTQKYGKIIIAVFVIIIVAVTAAYFLNDRNTKQLKEASIAYYRAEKIYKTGDFDIAVNGSAEIRVRGDRLMGFKEIADTYSSTTTGKTAAFFAALCYLKSETPDNAQARVYFEKAKKSDAPAILMGVYANIAALDELDGNYASAAKGYLSASEQALDDETKSRYLYFSGLAYEKDGKNSEAEKQYNEVLGDYDKTGFADEAKIALIRLGIEIE